MMAENGQTTDGKTVEVIDAGLFNRRGKDPDFFNVKLRINGTLWVGNVSVMENASDWYLYRMDKDKAFDNVILAVVGNADTDIRNSKGDYVNVMPMEIPQNLAKRYLMLASDQGQALCHQNVKENCTRLAVITQERESVPTSSANGSRSSFLHFLYFLLKRLLAIKQLSHNCPQLIHRQSTTHAEFHVLLTLARDAQFIPCAHPSISLIRSSRLSYSYTRPSSRSRSERSYDDILLRRGTVILPTPRISPMARLMSFSIDMSSMSTNICPCAGTVATFAIIISFYDPSVKVQRNTEIRFSFC
jgi:hypothetical protein